MMRSLAIAVFTASVILVACTASPKPASDAETRALELNADSTIAEFQRVDPGMSELFKSSPAYVVFPSVGKGAVGVGGAYGRGALYEGGKVVGYADLSQATIGLQLGGQEYSEVIFFESDVPLRSFKGNTLEFAAQASAVAASAGASTDADYENGVLVFTMARGGLMFEASIGGQRFRFVPEGESK